MARSAVVLEPQVVHIHIIQFGQQEIGYHPSVALSVNGDGNAFVVIKAIFTEIFIVKFYNLHVLLGIVTCHGCNELSKSPHPIWNTLQYNLHLGVPTYIHYLYLLVPLNA